MAPPGGLNNLAIMAAGFPTSKTVSCGLTAAEDVVEVTVTAGGSSLSYDATADQYNYVWKTDKMWAGTCRTLTGSGPRCRRTLAHRVVTVGPMTASGAHEMERVQVGDGPRPGAAPADGDSSSLADLWRRVASVALLGADRRPVPPVPAGPIGDLLGGRRPADGAEALAELAAALTVVRRAGMRPGPIQPLLVPPTVDPRPTCPQAAVERVTHLVDEWPELVDEWLGLVRRGGWRLPGDVTVWLLTRFRADPARRAAVVALSGDLADWLIGLFPALAVRGDRRPADRPESVPIGRSTGLDPATIAAGLESGALSTRHRTMLVHTIAGCDPAQLAPVAEALERAGANPDTMGLALSLADLARTRHEMITELDR